MKKIIIIAALAGAFIWHKGGLNMFSNANGAYAKSGSPEIWLFTFNGCGSPCSNAIDDLNNRDADYKNIKLDGDDKAKALWKKMGGGDLPFYVIGNIKKSGFLKSDVASDLAQVYGEKYLTDEEKHYMRNHFYEDGSPKVYIYGASWCPYCKNYESA